MPAGRMSPSVAQVAPEGQWAVFTSTDPQPRAHSTLRGGGWWFRAPEPAGREAGAGWGGEKAGSQAPRAWPGLPELALRGAFPWWGLSCGLSAPEGTTGGHVPRRAGKPWAIGGSRYAVRPCP